MTNVKEPVFEVTAELVERLLARIRNGEVLSVTYEFVDHYDTVGESSVMVEHDVRRLTINFGPKKP